MVCFSFAIFLLFFLSLIAPILSHSWMSEPLPYDRRTKPTKNCRGKDCTNYCPPLHYKSKIRPSNPSAIWRRGQRVTVSWTRNNHHGGMFRISLVPAIQVHDRKWHGRLVLLHGCWESGAHRCKSKNTCGTDKGRVMFSRKLTIPTVYPDGLYVLGYVWYGGLHFKRQKGHFPDFHSCSYVRIKGGSRLGGTYRPFFKAGTGRRVKNGKCPTSADAVGQCGNRGCLKTKAFYAIPKAFRKGGMKPITKEIVYKAMGNNAGEQRKKKEGICRFGVCCHSRCKQCGGSRCSRLPGGAKNCCSSTIKRGKRSCAKYDPPCVLNN